MSETLLSGYDALLSDLDGVVYAGPFAIPGATEAQLRLAIAMMYTMVDSFMHLWLIDGWPLDRDAAIEAMTDALYSTMR